MEGEYQRGGLIPTNSYPPELVWEGHFDAWTQIQDDQW